MTPEQIRGLAAMPPANPSYPCGPYRFFDRANLMEPAGARGLIDGAIERFGKVDVLVNNAGIQFVAPVDEFPDEKWQAIINLNLSAALEAAEQGITVNAICPAYVWTPLVEKQIPDTARARGISEEEVKRDVMLKAQPTRRFVETAEIGALAVFLCGARWSIACWAVGRWIARLDITYSTR